ncbi:MAG: ferredoxin--NADP reductase [Myxococcota bacterium]
MLDTLRAVGQFEFMAIRRDVPPRPPGPLDFAARAVSLALPRSAKRVDRLRLDLESVTSRLRGEGPSSYRDDQHAPPPPPALSEVDLLALMPRRVAERLRQTRRDLDMLTKRARGDRPSPLVERKPGGRSLPPPAPGVVVGLPRSLAPRVMKVVQLERETADAVSIYLEPEDGQPLSHVAGQFLSIDVDVDGVLHRRAYSLASPSSLEARPHITVKRVPNGIVSNHLNDHLSVGDSLSTLGPSGSFVVAPDPLQTRRFVLIAGGSGITPIMSIAHTVLLHEPGSTVTLLYGNRDVDSVIFRARLEDLASRFPKRLRLEHVWEKGDARAATLGRLDATTTTACLQACDALDDVHEYFVCGPTPMMDAVREALESAGVSHDRIHEERFTRPEDRQSAAVPEGPQRLRILLQGRETTVRADEGQTLLEAGLSAGLDIPFSCAMGGCAACKVKLVEGDVASDEPNCLTTAERQEGWVLACCSRALSPCTLEIV